MRFSLQMLHVLKVNRCKYTLAHLFERCLALAMDASTYVRFLYVAMFVRRFGPVGHSSKTDTNK